MKITIKLQTKNLLGKLARILITLTEVIILLLVFKNLIHDKNIFEDTKFRMQF